MRPSDTSNSEEMTYPTYLLIACLDHHRRSVMRYDSAHPWEWYSMWSCQNIDCDCVCLAGLGKTDDGELGYYGPDNITVDTHYMMCDPRFLEEIGFDPRLEGANFKLSDYSIYIDDPLIKAYLNGETDQIIKLNMPAFAEPPRPLDPQSHQYSEYSDDDEDYNAPPPPMVDYSDEDEGLELDLFIPDFPLNPQPQLYTDDEAVLEADQNLQCPEGWDQAEWNAAKRWMML
jgi:hypothetical protein